jgi:hypothetical protein
VRSGQYQIRYQDFPSTRPLSIDYVHLDNKSVMFVTIEAPLWGDPIFTLRKGYNDFEAGAIFVRSNGKTERSTAQDVAQLTTRAGRRDARLNVAVDWRRPPSLHAVSAIPREQVVAYVRARSERLVELRAVHVRDADAPDEP